MTPTSMKKLTIEHNHGVYVLTDVTLTPYDGTGYQGYKYVGHQVKGTVESGGVTNRLFWATSFQPAPKGKVMEYDIYGRTPYCCDRDADEWRVSVVSCG